MASQLHAVPEPDTVPSLLTTTAALTTLSTILALLPGVRDVSLSYGHPARLRVELLVDMDGTDKVIMHILNSGGVPGYKFDGVTSGRGKNSRRTCITAFVGDAA